MKKIFLFFGVLFFSFFQELHAQQILGRVLDDSSGTSVSGASIILKGGRSGTKTNDQGNFVLTPPGGQNKVSLTVSSVGYSALTATAEAGRPITVRLRRESGAMNEIVVIGYGAVRKRDLTGSVVSLKGAELTKVPTGNVLEAAQGKIAGADITRSSGQAGSGVNIRIRGNRSIGGSNSPLIIVDGIQYNNIQDINPNDIESMEVLKDASSVAIYGSRGANGVILITTKKGASGRMDVTVNSYAGVSRVSLYPKAMGLDEYIAFRREAYRASGQWNSPADDPAAFAGSGELNAIRNRSWTDYQEELIHNGFQQEHQVGLRGGTDRLKAYLSLGYYDEKGVLELDWIKRYTGRLNVDFNVNKWFKMGLQSQLTYYNQSVRRDPLNQANKVSPLGSLYDSTGNFNFFLLDKQTANPLSDEQPNVYKNSVNTTRSLINAYVELQPFSGLTARSTLGVNLVSARSGVFAAAKSIDRSLTGKSSSSITSSTGRTLNWENVVTYQKNIGNHALTVTGIASYLGNMAEDVSASGVNQLLPSQSFYALQNNAEQKEITSSYSETDLISFAGRLNYSFKGKYLLTLTARSDGSSKLAEGHKWTFFPSAAAAWRVKDEAFMKNVNFFNDVKLRASYGVAGNDPSGPYATQSALTRIAFGYDENPVPAYTFSRLVGNTDLAWELSGTKNVGLDVSFLKSRVNLTVDIYDTRTTDLLLVRGLPPTTGVTSVNQNIGKTRNRGIEITLGTTNIRTNQFSWTSSLTFTKNKEEILELVTGGVNDIGNGWFIGSPINVYYDYQKTGIWQTKDVAEAATFGAKPGEVRVKDQNGDGKIDTQNDRVILGTPRPKWSGGLDNTITFKNFDLNVFLFARIGQMINADRYARFDQQAIGNSTTGIDYWTPENPTNAYPRPIRTGGLQYLSTLAYQNGSFGRIRNLSLGYTFPATTLRNGFIKGLRIYATGKNLVTFTKLNYDPERGGSENFPMTKLFVFGLNVTL